MWCYKNVSYDKRFLSRVAPKQQKSNPATNLLNSQEMLTARGGTLGDEVDGGKVSRILWPLAWMGSREFSRHPCTAGAAGRMGVAFPDPQT